MPVAGDLHLAAMVGKMLLEKNGELEEKLTRLQQVAEQAAQENEVSAVVNACCYMPVLWWWTSRDVYPWFCIRSLSTVHITSTLHACAHSQHTFAHEHTSMCVRAHTHTLLALNSLANGKGYSVNNQME